MRATGPGAPAPAPVGPAAARGLAVVTGASSGIGAELAAGLAARGHPLLLVARRCELLQAHADRIGSRHGVVVETRAVDLTDREAREQLAAELAARPVEVLCNNAGVASFGAVSAAPAGELRAELELDVAAVHDLTLAALPGMVARGRGGLLFTGSLAGNLPIPRNATYAAAKAFVNHFAEALHYELAGTGVAVTLLAPGPVRPNPGDGEAADHPLPSWLLPSPAQVAAAGLAGLDRNARRVVPGVVGSVGTVLSRVVPHAVATPLVGRFYRAVDG